MARKICRKGKDSIFAPTRPLEALRMVLMLATTADLWVKHPGDLADKQRMQLSFIDIGRAYFNAHTNEDDPVYVELFPEDPDFGKGICGRLNVHMYGTRRAADGWHCECTDTLLELGFETGQASACVFVHKEKGLAISIHGDDFATA